MPDLVRWWNRLRRVRYQNVVRNTNKRRSRNGINFGIDDEKVIEDWWLLTGIREDGRRLAKLDNETWIDPFQVHFNTLGSLPHIKILIPERKLGISKMLNKYWLFNKNSHS